MNDAIFFGSQSTHLNDYNIVNIITNKSDLENYKNITIIVESLNIFGDVTDILNIREKYLKPNNISIYIIDQDILFSEWSDEYASDFELSAMISYVSLIDNDTVERSCNRIINTGQESWNEPISLFRSLLNKN